MLLIFSVVFAIGTTDSVVTTPNVIGLKKTVQTWISYLSLCNETYYPWHVFKYENKNPWLSMKIRKIPFVPSVKCKAKVSVWSLY